MGLGGTVLANRRWILLLNASGTGRPSEWVSLSFWSSVRIFCHKPEISDSDASGEDTWRMLALSSSRTEIALICSWLILWFVLNTELVS